MLVARAAQARDVIPEALAERGAEVDVVALYETVREPADPQAVEAAQSADYVTFTSSSTVRNLLEAVGDRFPRSARVVSIGPVTTETARELGLEVAVEAERHDIEGLVEAAARGRGARFDVRRRSLTEDRVPTASRPRTWATSWAPSSSRPRPWARATTCRRGTRP